MMELMLQVMLILSGMLVITLIYFKLNVSQKQPDGNFGDVMSHYMWQTKKRRAALKVSRIKSVKRHKFRKRFNVIDGKIADKICDVAIEVETKTKDKVKHINETHVKKAKLKIKQMKPKKKVNKKDKMISQLREVYKND